MPKPPPVQKHLIQHQVIAFILDRRAAKRSPATIRYYENELRWFQTWLESVPVSTMDQITPTLLRTYLDHLSATRNVNGLHATYRALKAFLNWWVAELDDGSKNPILKVTPPKPTKEPIPGVTIDHIHALISTCNKDALGLRDRAILLTLLDTGLRKSEFVKLDLTDLNLRTGALQVRAGKGNKDRTVYTGARSRQAIIRYLRTRGEIPDHAPLWATNTGKRLTDDGLRDILHRRALAAGIPEPSPHDFRRAFAIQSLRNGMDLMTLMQLMGHTDPTILRRYLRLTEKDLARSHERASPADNM